MSLRRTRLVRRTPLRRGKPLPAQSAKRMAEVVPRRALVAAVLDDVPICERCQAARSIDLHEPLMRSQGGDPLDRAQVRAICRACHDHIHANPAESYAAGWLVRRTAA